MGAVLAKAKGSSMTARAKALSWAGWLAWEQGDYELSIAFSGESLALFRELGDEAGAAGAPYNLGMAALFQTEFERASATLEETLTLQRALGDR